jgi:hypothetical protein
MPMPSLTFAVNIIQPFSPASSAPRQTSAPDSRNYRKITEKLARNIRQNSLLNFSITIISTTYDENKKFFYGARSKWEKSGKFAASLVPSAARPANKEPNI